MSHSFYNLFVFWGTDNYFFYYSGVILVVDCPNFAIRSKLVWHFRMTETHKSSPKVLLPYAFLGAEASICAAPLGSRIEGDSVTIRVPIKTRKVNFEKLEDSSSAKVPTIQEAGGLVGRLRLPGQLWSVPASSPGNR